MYIAFCVKIESFINGRITTIRTKMENHLMSQTALQLERSEYGVKLHIQVAIYYIN